MEKEGGEGSGVEGGGVEWRRQQRRWRWRWRWRWRAARFPNPRLSPSPHPSGIAVILQTECHALQTADKRDRYHSRLLKEGQRWERGGGRRKRRRHDGRRTKEPNQESETDSSLDGDQERARIKPDFFLPSPLLTPRPLSSPPFQSPRLIIPSFSCVCVCEECSLLAYG